MALNPRDNSSPPWLQIIFALALTVGAAWVQLPLDSNRPLPTSEGAQFERIQNIDTRLWQDPFSAIGKQEETDKKCFEMKASANGIQIVNAKCASNLSDKTGRRDVKWLAKLIEQKPSEPLLLMQVMVSGSPSVGDQESRRRIRYAVLSALQGQGYAPEDAEHIGYINVEPDKSTCVSMPKVIPFEWFVKNTQQKKEYVLVLWMDEGALISDRFSTGAYGSYLHQPTPKACMNQLADELVGSSIRKVVIGPASSAGLLAINEEFKTSDALDIYSPFATITLNPDQALVDRTIRQDQCLVKKLWDELGKRDIHLQVQQDSAIALVGQWDTDYARGLKQDFLQIAETSAREEAKTSTCEEAKTNGPEEAKTSACEKAKTSGAEEAKTSARIYAYGFMRGLDGKLPEKSKEAKSSAQGKADSGKTESDSIERVEGDAQTDYLRRMSDDLLKKDAELRRHCKFSDRVNKHCGIRAIGVFANDYYDKLLVLKALKPKFPDAVFFSTDLDAAMLHPGDNEYTRNLIVASVASLSPDHNIESREVAPMFRDAYQTAAYYTVSTLLTTPSKQEAQQAYQSIPPLQPKLFEIGRSHAVNLDDSSNTSFAWSLNFWLLALLSCLVCCWYLYSVQLKARLYRSGKLLVLFWGNAQTSVLHFPRLAAGSLFLALIAGILCWLAWQDISCNGEPFYWGEGVSIWPSELLRFAAFVSAILLLWHAKFRMGNNVAKSKQDFFHWIQVYHISHEALANAWKKYEEMSQFKKILKKASVNTFFMFFTAFILMLVLSFPNVPARSNLARYLDLFITLGLAVPFSLLLVFSVAVYIARTTEFFDALVNQTNWPESVMSRFKLPVGKIVRFEDWVDLQLIARITTHMGGIVFYPLLPLALLLSARSRLFDAWNMPLALLMLMGLAFGIVLLNAWNLRNKAEKVRARAIKWLERRLVDLHGSNVENKAELLAQANQVLDQMRSLHEGAFASISQQPAVRGLLVAIGAVSGIKLAEYFAVFNF